MRFIALVFTVSWKLSHCFPKNMKSCKSILPSSSAGYIPVPTDTCIGKKTGKKYHRAMSTFTQTWKELQLCCSYIAIVRSYCRPLGKIVAKLTCIFYSNLTTIAMDSGNPLE